MYFFYGRKLPVHLSIDELRPLHCEMGTQGGTKTDATVYLGPVLGPCTWAPVLGPKAVWALGPAESKLGRQLCRNRKKEFA